MVTSKNCLAAIFLNVSYICLFFYHQKVGLVLHIPEYILCIHLERVSLIDSFVDTEFNADSKRESKEIKIDIDNAGWFAIALKREILRGGNRTHVARYTNGRYQLQTIHTSIQANNVYNLVFLRW